MQNIAVAEGEFCRFETQLAPVNDPYMKIEWFKDKKPVLLGGSRQHQHLWYVQPSSRYSFQDTVSGRRSTSDSYASIYSMHFLTTPASTPASPPTDTVSFGVSNLHEVASRTSGCRTSLVR